MTADRPRVVLVPGLLCDAAVWAGQAVAVRAVADVQVAEHGLLDTLGAMAEKILAEVSGHFWIAGHSMGGRVALEVLRRAPDRVAGLALLDTGCQALPAGGAGERERHSRQGFVQQCEQQGMAAMSSAWLVNMVHPDRRDDAALTSAIIAMQGRRSPAHMAAQTRALLARPEACQVLAAARCPVLVLSGSHDGNSPPEVNREMAALVKHSRLLIIEDCGHMAPMERPDEVAGALREWLASAIH